MTLDRMNAPERWRNTLDEPEFEKNMRREAPVFANINLLGRSNVDCYFCLGKDIETEFKNQNQLAVHFSKWANFEQYLLKCEQAGIRRIMEVINQCRRNAGYSIH